MALVADAIPEIDHAALEAAFFCAGGKHGAIALDA